MLGGVLVCWYSVQEKEDVGVGWVGSSIIGGQVRVWHIALRLGITISFARVEENEVMWYLVVLNPPVGMRVL